MDFESTTRGADRPLRIVIAGGGTGGHVSPAVAVIEELRGRMPVELLWIGARRSLEAETAARLTVPFRAVMVGKLRRYPSFQTAVDAFRIPVGVGQARRILRQFSPDVVFSTGGYVSVPAVVAARSLGIPSITHEQTAHLGLATRINARFCDVIALSFERSRSALGPTHARAVVTGNPVRDVVLSGTPNAAYARFGLPGKHPLVYVTGGAQGARAINDAVAGSLPELLPHVEIIHQYGPRSIQHDNDEVLARASRLPDPLPRRYRLVERTGDEIGDIYATAALVVGRAGAGTVAELAAVGLPSILIPLPGAEEQRQNALFLVEAGAAVMLSQDELTSECLTELVLALVRDEGRLRSMREAARRAASHAPAQRLVDEILALAERSDQRVPSA